jgi:PAS domain S-box-containing protein
MTARAVKKGRSIQQRLIVLLLSVLIPVLAIQAYIYYDTYQDLRAAAFQSNLEVARALAKAFDSFAQDVIHQELAIGLAITASQPLAPDDIRRILDTSRDYDAIREFTWLNAKGVAVYSSNPRIIGMVYSDRAFFQEVAGGREWIVGELIKAQKTGGPIFHISRAIRDGKGKLLGVVTAAVVPEKLDFRLAVPRSAGGGHALVDNKGMMVYRYPEIHTTWEERYWLKDYPQFGDALRGREVTATVYAPFEGKNRMVGFVPVSSIGWAASAGKREEDVIGPILGSIAKSALLFLSVSLAAFLVALAVSRKITGPVKALQAHARSLGQGAEPEPVEIDRVSEFEDLAEAFHIMAGEVQARETALRRERDLLQTVMNGAKNSHLVYLDNDFNFVRVNETYAESCGYRPEAMIGKNHFALYPDAENEAIFRRVRDSGEPVTYYDKPFVFPDQPERGITYWDWTLTPVKDPDGRVTGLVFSLFETTERKQAEDALREAHARTADVLAGITEAFYSLDDEWRFVTVNPAAERAPFAQPADRLLGRVIWEVFPALVGTPVQQHYLDAVEKQRTEHYEAQSPLNGRWYEVFMYPRRGGLDVYLRDIDERRKAEAALQEHAIKLEERKRQLEDTVQELERFSYTVSHDLKAPLRAIDGFSRMILSKHGDGMDADAIRRLKVIRENAQTMGRLIEDLLSFSRFSRSRMDAVEIDMKAMASDVWAGIREANPQRAIELTTGSILPGVGDPTLIRQVMFNLLSNAVKFTRGREPALIELCSYYADGEIVYSVKDNGVGFDMQYAGKLFGVFERLHSDEYEGTGVGLAIVQRIIYRHGGRVWAEGKEGEGATFYFTLPDKEKAQIIS